MLRAAVNINVWTGAPGAYRTAYLHGDYVTVTSRQVRADATGRRNCLLSRLILFCSTDILALPWPLWYLGAWRMQSCYSSPQQLQAAAAAALSFHQHQQRLAFPLMHTSMTRRDDVGDDVTTDDITSRLTAERRVCAAFHFRSHLIYELERHR